MTSQETCSAAIKAFAFYCEKLTEFSTALRNSGQFYAVRSGADIRLYSTGWRLEKWVEAQIDQKDGLWGCWWLELGSENDGWVVQSNLSISNNEYYRDLLSKTAISPDELEAVLAESVRGLINALSDSKEFATAMRIKKG